MPHRPVEHNFTEMKDRLRNYGLYYLAYGVLMAISFVLFKLWPIALLGLLMLGAHFFVGRRGSQRSGTTGKPWWASPIDIGVVIFPLLLTGFVLWYPGRAYRQLIVLPDRYEGRVWVQYDRPDGDAVEWMGGLFGVGASRVIRVGRDGIAKTQAVMHDNDIEVLDAHTAARFGQGAKIVFADNLDQELIPNIDISYKDHINQDPAEPSLFFVTPDVYPDLLFVVTNVTDYCTYFQPELQETVEDIYDTVNPDSCYVNTWQNELLPEYDPFKPMQTR